ncbi:MAG: glycosyl transferase [Chthoniobacteraceae bacterium]
MADFFQTGAIATLHRLGPPNAARLEAELCALSAETPIALVLPCHVRELGTPALERILGELKGARYLRQIVVGIDGADTAAKWSRARKIFGELSQETVLLWNDGPRISRLLRMLSRHDLGDGPAGKGRNVWLCLGEVFSTSRARIVAMHDCDIVNYSRELLARLCYPLANPALGFGFCKGYYARVSDRLHGRVTRLLVAPLLGAMRDIVGEHPLLGYLGAFRYPLAGEVAVRTEHARRLRVPRDWALELGVLAETYRHCAPSAVCQAELCDNYDHRHQSLSPRDPSRGLHKVAREVVLALFRSMSGEGVKMDAGLLGTLPASYERHAAEALHLYSADALINSLEYPRRDEELAVATFVRAIHEAARAFIAAPHESPSAPGWDRVAEELPDFLPALRDAIAADNRARLPR